MSKCQFCGNDTQTKSKTCSNCWDRLISILKRFSHVWRKTKMNICKFCGKETEDENETCNDCLDYIDPNRMEVEKNDKRKRTKSN